MNRRLPFLMFKKLTPCYTTNSVVLKRNQRINSLKFLACANSTSQSSGNEDILAGRIRRAHSAEQLTDLIDTHCSVMNNDHLVSALESLFNFKKENSLTSSVEDTPYFENLCKRLKGRAQYYEIDQVVNILKCLSYLGMSSETPVMQTYFQMLRHQMNSLSLKQLLYLEFLLKKQHSTPLVEALMIALPIVLENQLDLQMDPTNLSHLVELFCYGARHGMSSQSVKKIADAILNCPENLNAAASKNILWSYLIMRRDCYVGNELFDESLEVLIAKIDEVSPAQLVSLLAGFNRKRIFCTTLLQAVGKRNLDEIWPLSLTHSLINTMVNLDSFYCPLLDHYASLINRNEAEVKLNPKISIFTIMEAFGQANVLPQNSENFLRIIAECSEKIEDLSNKPRYFLKFALNLAIFDCFPPSVFDKICCNHFSMKVENLIKDPHHLSLGVREALLKEMLLLHQIMQSKGHNFELSNEMKTEAIGLMKNVQDGFPILKALEKALGGEQYVASALLTKSGLYIDHYIILRPGDYPVALNESQFQNGSEKIQYAEDIDSPADSKRVALILHRSSDLTSDSTRVNGLAQLRIQLLGKEGYHVVELVLPVWKELPDHEKIPFLMREIKGFAKLSTCESDHN